MSATRELIIIFPISNAKPSHRAEGRQQKWYRKYFHSETNVEFFSPIDGQRKA